MRKVGHVEIDRLDLAAKCMKCGKGIAYEKGSTLMAWKLILAGFISKHSQCGTK